MILIDTLRSLNKTKVNNYKFINFNEQIFIDNHFNFAMNIKVLPLTSTSKIQKLFKELRFVCTYFFF